MGGHGYSVYTRREKRCHMQWVSLLEGDTIHKTAERERERDVDMIPEGQGGVIRQEI